MQTRLTSLQDILERLVSRLGRIEDEVARVDEARARDRHCSRHAEGRRAADPQRAARVRRRSVARNPRSPRASPSAAPVRQPLPQAGAIDGADFCSSPARRSGARVCPRPTLRAQERRQRPYCGRAPRRAGGHGGERRRESQTVRRAGRGGEGAPHDLARQAKSLLAGRRRPLLLAATLLAMIATVAIIEMRAGSHPPLMQKSEIEAPAKLRRERRTRQFDRRRWDRHQSGRLHRRLRRRGQGRRQAAARRTRRRHARRALGGAARRRDGGRRRRGIRNGAAPHRRARRRARSARAPPDGSSRRRRESCRIAQYRLGALYEKGVGVTRDSEPPCPGMRRRPTPATRGRCTTSRS